MGEDRTTPPAGAAREFVEAAREYVSWVECRQSGDTYLMGLERTLAQLMAQGSDLPEPISSRLLPLTVTADDWNRQFQHISDALGRSGFYWQVPQVGLSNEPVAVLALLAEDLVAIWRELKDGLLALNNGFAVMPVLCQWRFGYETSWGRRAAMGLTAIHHHLYPSTPGSQA